MRMHLGMHIISVHAFRHAQYLRACECMMYLHGMHAQLHPGQAVAIVPFPAESQIGMWPWTTCGIVHTELPTLLSHPQ